FRDPNRMGANGSCPARDFLPKVNSKSPAVDGGIAMSPTRDSYCWFLAVLSGFGDQIRVESCGPGVAG
ncbi:MAG: hypothetical protein ACREQ5_14900, partial [Candidatus Dormibacteria bacterium]